MREKLINILGGYDDQRDKNPFNLFIITIIITNSIVLGLEAIFFEYDTQIFSLLNEIFLYVFIIEMIMKLFAWRIDFFKNIWNIFDLIIILICLVPVPTLSIFRALRVIRIFRILSSFSKTRRIISALVSSLPSMFSVILLLLLFFYIYAILCTHLFGHDFPEYFGSFGNSIFSLFQIMTFDSWSTGISRPVMDIYPYAGFIFVSFIFITSYCILNLVVGIIVTSMQEEALDDESCIKYLNISKELKEIKKELQSIRENQVKENK